MNKTNQTAMGEEASLAEARRRAAPGAPSMRKNALAAGILYLLTFVSIPTLALYTAVRSPNYILGAGPDNPALIGAVLEFIVALAGVGTAVALFPVIKRQNEGIALGFLGSRTLEGAAIFAGVACLLSVVSLRQAGAGAAALVNSQMLVAMYDRLFFLGQSMMPVFNALLLGTLLYRSRLVPRVLPLLGFVGAALLLVSNGAILFGFLGRVSPLAGISALPIALWEFSLGVWLVVKGFNTNSSVITNEPKIMAANELLSAAD